MPLFDYLEEVGHSTVEYVPVAGTIYSLVQASMASRKHDSLNLWLSLANYLESAIRDVVFISGVGEPATVAIVHAMGESATEKIIEVFHRESKDSSVKRGTYVFAPEGKSESEIFTNKAKGVQHFLGAIFTGTLKLQRYHPEYTTDADGNNGMEIRLYIPHGLYEGAQVTFVWKWAKDAEGTLNRREMSEGSIQLNSGAATWFELSQPKGIDGSEGYNFTCDIMSKDRIKAKTRMVSQDVDIFFERVPPGT